MHANYTYTYVHTEIRMKRSKIWLNTDEITSISTKKKKNVRVCLYHKCIFPLLNTVQRVYYDNFTNQIF